jgi:2-C-methyl-D-erythritol 4-phosphate cytidylyltransferase/2-C-methyl-D-erythritol 2,4-cyclodiphosphate synthase
LPAPIFVSAIIAAGGRGRRLGGARPKQLLSIRGRPILERSVSAFLAHPSIDEVVVALAADLAAAPPDYLLRSAKPLRVVAGGGRRQDSVANAFREVSQRADIVVVHDAARPFVSGNLIERTIAAAAESGAALAALPCRDTVKRGVRRPWGPGGGLEPHASTGVLVVAETLPREWIFLAQTPQAFRRAILRDALLSTEESTDEAALVERAGHEVRLVEGEPWNIKITMPEDVPIAEAIAVGVRASDRPADRVRIGTGYDFHRMVGGRPLVLGGVTIPFDRGLLGHSDADAICHALTDAVLGAAAAGDIGGHFPDTDPEWAGASSLDLLRRAAGIAGTRGYAVTNVDVVVIAERPTLHPYVDAMRSNVAAALGVTPDCVSIKGKTNEGVGELGRGEAIAVHAVALVNQR